MSIKLFGGRLTLDILLLPVAALLVYAYGAGVCACFALALLAHEFAHALAARAFGARIASIELLPFGCAAVLEGLGTLSAAKEAAVAAAGPLAGMAIAAGANMLSGGSAFLAQFARLSLGLSAVNLLPVPPLDGGRVFIALLGLAVPRLRAEKAAAVTGISIGAVFFCLCIYLMSTGTPNVTFGLMSIFMVTSSIRRMRSAEYSFAKQLFARRDAMKKRTVLDVRHIAASDTKDPSELLPSLDPRKYNVIHFVDRDMRTVRTVDEGELFDTLIDTAKEK